MITYGWWYEDAHWFGCNGEDLWDVVGQGVEQAAADRHLADLRVGELVDLHVDEMIDEEDVVDLPEKIFLIRDVELKGDQKKRFDQIRDELAEMGYEVRDSAEGPRLVPKS